MHFAPKSVHFVVPIFPRVSIALVSLVKCMCHEVAILIWLERRCYLIFWYWKIKLNVSETDCALLHYKIFKSFCKDRKKILLELIFFLKVKNFSLSQGYLWIQSNHDVYHEQKHIIRRLRLSLLRTFSK